MASEGPEELVIVGAEGPEGVGPEAPGGRETPGGIEGRLEDDDVDRDEEGRDEEGRDEDEVEAGAALELSIRPRRSANWLASACFRG
jgi:hypothetical protein